MGRELPRLQLPRGFLIAETTLNNWLNLKLSILSREGPSATVFAQGQASPEREIGPFDVCPSFSHLAQRSPYTEGVPGWGVQKFGHKRPRFLFPDGKLKTPNY